jgi:hypothetical protein
MTADTTVIPGLPAGHIVAHPVAFMMAGLAEGLDPVRRRLAWAAGGFYPGELETHEEEALLLIAALGNDRRKAAA